MEEEKSRRAKKWTKKKGEESWERQVRRESGGWVRGGDGGRRWEGVRNTRKKERDGSWERTLSRERGVQDGTEQGQRTERSRGERSERTEGWMEERKASG